MQTTRRQFLGSACAGLAGMTPLGRLAHAAPLWTSAGDEADEQVFNDTQIIDLELIFSQADWWNQLLANVESETDIPATLRHAGADYPNVGVRFKGNSSYRVPGVKKPFNIDINSFVDAQRFHGLKALNLNNSFKDPTMMRERIAYAMLKAMGVPCSRSSHCRLTINGTLWGLYVLVEQVDGVMTDLFWEDRDGNRFKGDPRGDLTWVGSSQSSYTDKYELKNNETENDWSDLIHFIDVLNNTSIANLPTALPPVFDVDNFLKALAVNTLLTNLDSYQGSGHNYYLLDTDPSVGRMVHIPWDLNEAFGNFNMGMSMAQIRTMALDYAGSASARPLITRILQVPLWRDLFHWRVQQTLDACFTEAWVDAQIDRMHALISEAVAADPNKLHSHALYLENQTNDVSLGSGTPGGSMAAGLRDFTAARAAYARGVVGATPQPTPGQIADHLTGAQTLTGTSQFAADMDGDGVITVMDLVRSANAQ